MVMLLNNKLLNKQVQHSIHGEFDEAKECIKQLEDDPRALFNKGWYELADGDLQEGHRLLDYGRSLNCFGNRHIGSKQPIWDKTKTGTILLNLEGGLGDQIHGVRWAKYLVNLGNKVIVSCSSDLACLFDSIEHVSAVAQKEAALGIYHDYWLPSMSTVVALELEYRDLTGEPYIERKGSGDYIGLKWAGNPQFEHEQHRLFPPELMFRAVKGQKCLSLQKEGNEICPSWAEKPCLDTWEDTRNAVSSCKLVISSCTSIAHLAASMGIPTWIVIPILPYYLWALPGAKTPYYNSVTLFRQQKYGDWEHPFKEIAKQLS